MSEERNWRDAKTPQWVKDSVNAELDTLRLTTALAWPTEAKPAPMSFRWGGYDQLHGEPCEGIFWTASVEKIHIRKNEGKFGQRWQTWAFSRDGERWNTNIPRGPLFDAERDARLWALWAKCEEYARHLMNMRKGL